MLKKIRNRFLEEDAEASKSDIVCLLVVVASLLMALNAVIIVGGI